jgi:hypothetical protein
MIAVGDAMASERPPSAAATADSGPAGDVFWSGFNWTKETLAAGQTPASPSNISGPDRNGYLRISMTNGGDDPVGAELVSTRAGFGYGTYTSVVAGPLSTMGRSNVFGGFFTYDGGTAGTHNEIDWHETSRWGLADSPVGLDHSYYYDDNGATTSNASTVPIPSDLVQTHVVRWEPGRLTFDSYAGTGTGGRLISHDVQDRGVPVPGREHLVVNLWAFIGSGSTTSATDATPITVELRSLTVVPLGQGPR